MSLRYIDVHTHHRPSENNSDEVVYILNEAIGKASEQSLNYFSIGVHPWYINEYSEFEIKKMSGLTHLKNCLAIGEIGLDKLAETSFDEQYALFTKQLMIAAMANKPIIIHCVKAYSEMYAALRYLNLPIIVHAYNENLKIANDFIDINGYLSFGKLLWDEKSTAFKIFNGLPLDKLFLETDDAEFTIQEVYRRASFIRGCSLGDLELAMIRNFEKVFQVQL